MEMAQPENQQPEEVLDWVVESRLEPDLKRLVPVESGLGILQP